MMCVLRLARTRQQGSPSTPVAPCPLSRVLIGPLSWHASHARGPAARHCLRGNLAKLDQCCKAGGLLLKGAMRGSWSLQRP